jgi:hypothetical protein
MVFPALKQWQLLNLTPQGWISTNGIYVYTPWGSPKWSSSKWDKDFSKTDRENDSIVLVVLSTYCPTLYLTTGLPAVFVRCPKDANLRDQEQIESDCIYVSDDTVTLWNGVGENPNLDSPMGVSADSDWITF